MALRTQVDPTVAFNQAGGFVAAERVAGEWIDISEWELSAFLVDLALGGATDCTLDVEARARGGEPFLVTNSDGSTFQATFAEDGTFHWPPRPDGSGSIRAHQIRIGATFTGSPVTATSLHVRAVKVQDE
jgi:hypothetical protein